MDLETENSKLHKRNAELELLVPQLELRYKSANADRIARSEERARIASELLKRGLLLNPDGTISERAK